MSIQLSKDQRLMLLWALDECGGHAEATSLVEHAHSIVLAADRDLVDGDVDVVAMTREQQTHLVEVLDAFAIRASASQRRPFGPRFTSTEVRHLQQLIDTAQHVAVHLNHGTTGTAGSASHAHLASPASSTSERDH